MKKLLTALLAAALYLLFAGQASRQEMILALPIGVLATAFGIAMGRTGRQRFALRRDTLQDAGAALAALPADIGHVGALLAQAIRRRPFRPLGRREIQPIPARTSIRRRAQLILRHSLAPNGIALGPAPDGSGLLLHRLGRWEDGP